MKFVNFQIIDGDTIVPNYSCGLSDKSVWLHYHGAQWATWKLIDQAQKHLGKCEACWEKENSFFHKNDKELKEFFMSLAEGASKMTENMKTLGQASDLLVEAIADALLDALAEEALKQAFHGVKLMDVASLHPEEVSA